MKKASSLEKVVFLIRGRLILIRISLSNFPIYLMSIFHLPWGVKSRLDGGGGGGGGGGGVQYERKVHLVNWRIISLSKEKRGLGIRNVKPQKYPRILIIILLHIPGIN